MKNLATLSLFTARCAVLLLAFWPSVSLAIPQDEFDSLFNQLDDAKFPVRNAAEQKLTEYATMHTLTGAQIRTIQTANVNLEVQKRSSRIFAAFVHTLTSYKDIQKAVQTVLTAPAEVNQVTGVTTRPGRFNFDDAKGRYSNMETHNNFRLLENGYLKINTALLAGNVAAAKDAMQALRADVAALDQNAFSSNFIAPNNGGDRLNRNDILNKIDEGLGRLGQFRLDLINGGAADDSALPVPAPVMNAGLLPLGQSAQLALSVVTSTGSLLVLTTDEDDAPALAPEGYQFVSPVFLLQAGDGLGVSGPVSISLEFGSAALLGIPDSLLSDLRIVRIANDQDFLLPTNFSSPDFLTGQYTPDSLGVSPDQFGEFAIVMPVPEPGAMTVFGVVLMGAVLWLHKPKRTKVLR
jgi:hypothetical protein